MTFVTAGSGTRPTLTINPPPTFPAHRCTLAKLMDVVQCTSPSAVQWGLLATLRAPRLTAFSNADSIDWASSTIFWGVAVVLARHHILLWSLLLGECVWCVPSTRARSDCNQMRERRLISITAIRKYTINALRTATWIPNGEIKARHLFSFCWQGEEDRGKEKYWLMPVLHTFHLGILLTLLIFQISFQVVNKEFIHSHILLLLEKHFTCCWIEKKINS